MRGPICVTAIAALMVLAFMAAWAAPASAACTKTWTGAVDSTWETAGNWSPAGVPGPGDGVCILAGSPTTPVLGSTVGSSQTIASLQVDTSLGLEDIPSAGDMTLTVTGNATVSGSASLNMKCPSGCAGGNDTFAVEGTFTNAGTTNVANAGTNIGNLDGDIVNTGTIGITSADAGFGLAPGDVTATLDNEASILLTGSGLLTTSQTITNEATGSITNNTLGPHVLSTGVFNEAGTIGQVNLPVQLTGGATLNYTGTGGGQIEAVGHGTITLTGDINAQQSLGIDGDSTANLAVTAATSFTNAGTITLDCQNSCAAGTETLTTTSGALTNTGTIDLPAANTAVLPATVQNAGTLIPAGGQDDIGAGGTGQLTQSGGSTDVGAGATLQAGSFTLSGGTLDGNGTVTNGASGVSLHNTGGTVIPGTGGGAGSLSIANEYLQSGGATVVGPNSTLTVGFMSVTGGTVSGGGVAAPGVITDGLPSSTVLQNAGGTVAPGSSGKAGTLDLTGGYEQDSGTLQIYVAGAANGQHSLLKVSGSEMSGGTLQIVPSASYASSATTGDTFPILQWNSGPGTDGFSPPPAPVNTAAPSLSGTPAVGQSLACSPGSWSNGPAGYAYQWTRDGTDIPGAVASSYAVADDDDGHQLACRVTATNAPLTGGRGFAPQRDATGRVINAVVVDSPAGTTASAGTGAQTVTTTPDNTTTPSISGTGAVGQPLTCSPGSWAFTPTSYSYQWERDGVAIPGATGARYPVQSADAGHLIACRVTASNGRGSSSAATTQVRIVATSPAGGGTLPPPQPGKSVDVIPAGGTVLVELPGSHTFIPLTVGRRIPLGSLIDSTRGRATLIVARDRRGDTSTGTFYGGIFRTGQITQGGRLLTVLTLAGPKPQGCPAHHGALLARHKPKQRKLWASSTNGNFQTKGSDASATERGTIWLTEDTCAGTLVRVTKDAVTVDDFPHHRSFILKAGHSFTAHPGSGG